MLKERFGGAATLADFLERAQANRELGRAMVRRPQASTKTITSGKRTGSSTSPSSPRRSTPIRTRSAAARSWGAPGFRRASRPLPPGRPTPAMATRTGGTLDIGHGGILPLYPWGVLWNLNRGEAPWTA